jgi:hypothetical protein
VTPAGLEKLLWRHDYGRVGRARLELELNDALRRASDARAAAERHRAVVERQQPGLFAARDASLRAARVAIDAGHYREAANQLCRCDELAATMSDLASAHADVERATAVLADLGSRVATAVLRQLPAIASLVAVVSTARAHMAAARYREASHIANICVRAATPLVATRTSTSEEHADVSARTSALETLCAATQPFAPPHETDPVADGAVSALRNLLAGGSVTLTLRLLTELEISLGGRMRFLRHCRRKAAAGALTARASDALRALVREHSWDGAIEHEWQQAMLSHADLLTSHARRIVSAAASLDAALQ